MKLIFVYLTVLMRFVLFSVQSYILTLVEPAASEQDGWKSRQLETLGDHAGG